MDRTYGSTKWIEFYKMGRTYGSTKYIEPTGSTKWIKFYKMDRTYGSTGSSKWIEPTVLQNGSNLRFYKMGRILQNGSNLRFYKMDQTYGSTKYIEPTGSTKWIAHVVFTLCISSEGTTNFVAMDFNPMQIKNNP